MINIDPDSPVPKYKQIINSVTMGVEKGYYRHDQQLPSINEMSEEHYLARDTVEKAYNELKERGVIKSVRGKGYFVQVQKSSKIKVLLIMNKLSSYKKIIYYSFLKALGDNALVDLHIHHYNAMLFKEIWEANKGKYNHYVIMPHFFEGLDKVDIKDLIDKIPKNELVLLDRDLPNISGEYLSIYQDFEKDILRALESCDDLLQKYTELILIFPGDAQYPDEIVRGFRTYCVNYNKEYRLLENTLEETPSAGKAYIVMEETDLADLVKKIATHGLKLGKDVGIISFNDTTLKEVLADGITVMTTDFETMGRTAAALMLDAKRIKVKNPFTVIRRKSL